MAKLCAMYTGGKDSCYALHLAVAQGFEPVCLVTLRPRGWESLLFHYPGLDIVRLHSEAMGLPLLEVDVAGDEYKSLVHALKTAKSLCGCRFISAGALLSYSQWLRFTMAAEEADVKLYTPNWGRNQVKYLLELVDSGIKFIIISVQAYGLSPRLLGRIVDRETALEIVRLAEKYGFNPAFEGGEAETLVVDAPLFKKTVNVKGFVERVGPDHYVYKIVDARLTPKKGVSEAKLRP